MTTVARLAAAPYVRGLGLVVEDAAAEGVRVRVPYKDDNSNPGRALHGGVAASTIGVAGALAACAGSDARAGLEAGTLDLAVAYLAAAVGEDIVADGRVLRRGKEITYVDVAVRNDAGKAIAHGLVTHRAAPVGPADRSMQWEGVEAEIERSGDLPPIARVFVSVPFIARLGVRVALAENGLATARLPFKPENADADGAVHEGALAALVDTTGALASWSLAGPVAGAKASTVGLHVTYHAAAAGEEVLARARTLTRRDEIFLNAVTVTGASSGRLVAAGTVTYRIVVA
ncbi:MAG TPA: hotdog fold thioesterase [Candidatus Binatia bacterium]|nr:hotdog fold thioesterase [Candidatus Binatia bacterium]